MIDIKKNKKEKYKSPVKYKLLDFLFNRKLKNYALGPNAIEIVGMRGAGKSSIYALVAEVAKSQGKKVYCQYPYEGCYQIPVIEVDQGQWFVKDRIRLPNGKWIDDKEWHPHKVYMVDKEWLYSTDFSDAVVLLDEARTIYPARGWQSWTISDDEFFNFLRHLNVTVYLSSQEYSALDVNVHRAVDEVWFLWKKSKNSSWTHVDVYSSMTVPVEDLNKNVKLSFFSKEMHPLNWDICSSLDRSFKFWRPPYYGLFDTNFYYGKLLPAEVEKWDSLLLSE